MTDNGKPRGACTGCKFEYQLGTARSGEYKGQLVVRKHNSRTGPGLCDGASKPPKQETPEVCACGGTDPDCPNGCGSMFADPAPVEETWQLEQDLPHDRAPETVNVPGAPVASVQEIPDGHDVTSTSGLVFRHGGPLVDCTVQNCVQYRNRMNPPPVMTPVQHQCSQGLFADQRNCPEHDVPTIVVQLPATANSVVQTTQLAEPVSGPATIVGAFAVAPGSGRAGSLNGVPTGHTHYGRGDELHQGRVEECTLPPCTTQSGLVFADPAPAPQELPPVSGQPEPERDRWGRYKILGTSHTRATTFAKLGSSTFALGEWNERMLIKGLVLRPDLLAMANGLDVKRDKATLNKIADDAQEYAGNKVAANIGTAYHSFTERLDAGLCSLDDVPEQWRRRCQQYTQALAEHGLTTRREWIERTTAVRADQVSADVPVAGTLDRIFQLPNGDLVIGDLKTSSNIDYSWSEIAVQLALYAHGVNTHGLFDWNTKTWQQLPSSELGKAPVRVDYAIVIHLPADGDGCTLYRVDIERGWKFAQVSGMVQTRQKAKNIAGVMVPPPAPVVQSTVPDPVVQSTVPPPRAELVAGLNLVRSHPDPNTLDQLFEYACSSGQFDLTELEQIREACAERWTELNIPY